MTIKRFNVKAGLSVGPNTPIDVIDANGNATFNSLAANSITTTSPNIQLPNANIGGTLDVSGNATFYGNLTVEGNITLIGSTDVAITDKNITLAYGAANATEANGGGITIAGANANITYISSTDSFNFNKTIIANAAIANTLQLANAITPITAAAGQVYWDTTYQTATLGMNNGVQLHLGQTQVMIVKATTAITKGQVVMFTGANGNNVQAAPANTASVGFKPEYIIGIATTDIADNGTGYITTTGIVIGLNTNSWTVGDILWVDNSTPGALTNVQPSDPNFQIQMAAVIKRSGGDGHVQVRPTFFFDLNRLTDVEIDTPLNGQALTYDSANAVWINANVVAVTAGTVTTNAQPNITSVGTLANLTVSGNIFSPTIVQNASSYDTRIELGSASGIIAITTDGNSTQFTPSGQINLGGVSTVAGGTFAGSQLELATAQTNLKQLRDGEVTIQVGTAGSATNTWTFANTGNLTLPSNTAAINYANGTSITALVANATYATTAGTADSVAGANVTGTVANATHANTASTATLAYSINGGLTNSLVVQNGPSATGYITVGNPTDILTVSAGNAPLWTNRANVTVGNANIANTAGTVTTAAQPNITSVGTLTSLATSGDITVGGNLTVNGTVTTVHSTEVAIDDKNITIAANATTAAQANGGGITINGASATMLYTSADDSWNFNKPIVGNLTGTASNANLATYATTANAVAGANVTGTVANATYATTAGTADSVAGANVTGWVANANIANTATTAGTVTTNAQPNITSVGTLTSLAVTGTTDLGTVGNVTITGGTSGQFLQTNGSGVLAWTTVNSAGSANGTSNVSIPVANGNVNTSVGGNANVFVVTGTGANVSGTFTVATDTSTDAVRITQTGTGNALVVEDSTNPDSTPFIVDTNGRVGVGGIPSTTAYLTISGPITDSVVTGAVQVTGEIQSSVTTNARYFRTVASTATASFTVGVINHYTATQGTFGAGSTVNNQFGFAAQSTLVGAINNYGFYSAIPNAANRWSFYAVDGAAPSYFGGNVTVAANLAVTGNTTMANITATTVYGTPNANSNIEFTSTGVNFSANGSANIVTFTTAGSGAAQVTIADADGAIFTLTNTGTSRSLTLNPAQGINASGGGNLPLIAGNSNVTVTANSNITMSVGGTANVVTVSTSGITVDGALNYDEVGTTPQMWFQGKLTGSFSMTNNVDNLVAWDSVSNPRSWTWDSGSNRRLVPGKVGWYRVTYKANYQASSTSGTTQINTQIRLNGNSQSIAVGTNNQYNTLSVVNTAFVYLSNVADYFEFTAYTNVSGQSLEGGTGGSSVLVEWASN